MNLDILMPALSPTTESGSVAAPSPPPGEGGGEKSLLASPLARRIADQTGLDLSTLKGSGPGGRIVKADVSPLRPPEVPPPAAGPRPTLEQQGIAPGSYDVMPLDGMRKAIARRMTESFRDIPHFPLTIDVEIDALLAARAKVNTLLAATGAKASINDLLIRAAAIALMRVREVNATFTPDGVALHRHADIAVAVAIPEGLITPVVRRADRKGVAQIAAETKDLVERARARRLRPEEYLGGTFTISNLGMFGIRSFSSIINEPQGAILSVGAGERRPVARGDAPAVATVMSLTLTCDHRAVDGAAGARFLAVLKALIEDPLAMTI